MTGFILWQFMNHAGLYCAVLQIDSVFETMINAQTEENMPLLKLKILELLLTLGKVDSETNRHIPAYLNQNQAKLAKTSQQMLVADLSVHYR